LSLTFPMGYETIETYGAAKKQLSTAGVLVKREPRVYTATRVVV
jgi:hypothetical protein